jgi:hypothetical protein
LLGRAAVVNLPVASPAVPIAGDHDAMKNSFEIASKRAINYLVEML